MNTGRPVQIVAIQANTATALGMVMMMLARAEEGQRQARQAGREHVVHPDAEAEHHGRHRRQRHRRVADQRPAAEGRQAVGDDAHGRQHDGVDPRVAEHPEQVLPEQRLAAAGGVEEMRAELAVEPQQEEGQADAPAPRSRLATEAVSVPQTRIGTRLIDMPGARVRSKRDDEVGRARPWSRCRAGSGPAHRRRC